MKSTCYVAVFDLSDDRERTRVAKLLEGVGMRVQKSVFECRLTRSGRQRLLDEVARLELTSGFLTLYKAGTEYTRYIKGKAPDRPLQDEDHAFLIT